MLKYSDGVIVQVHLSGVASKVPGWVERILIPSLEAKIRAIVSEEVAQLEKVMNAKFEAVESRFDAMDSKIEAINAQAGAVNMKVDSLEKRFPTVQELAEIKARLSAIERERR